MFSFQRIPVVHPTSFSGIYSEDDYLNDMAQRIAHDYAVAHARLQAVEHQRSYYNHSHRHQHHPRGPHTIRFAPATMDNFCYGFGPAPARPASFSPNHRSRATSHSSEELAYKIWQEEGRRRALNRRLEVIARQEELAHEREAHRQRAVAEAAARKQQAHAAHAARVKARQARDQEVLFALLCQLGLAIAPAQSASVAPQVNRNQVRIHLH